MVKNSPLEASSRRKLIKYSIIIILINGVIVFTMGSTTWGKRAATTRLDLSAFCRVEFISSMVVFIIRLIISNLGQVVTFYSRQLWASEIPRERIIYRLGLELETPEPVNSSEFQKVQTLLL